MEITIGFYANYTLIFVLSAVALCQIFFVFEKINMEDVSVISCTNKLDCVFTQRDPSITGTSSVHMITFLVTG